MAGCMKSKLGYFDNSINQSPKTALSAGSTTISDSTKEIIYRSHSIIEEV